MIRLSKPQILLLHEQLIAETGGSSGLRDEGMLDSALNTPLPNLCWKRCLPITPAKGSPSLLWPGKKSSLCRREQTYRRTCYAGVPRLKWDRITSYADRTVRGHPAISGRHPSIH